MCRRVVGEAERFRPVTPQRTRRRASSIMMMDDLDTRGAPPERGDGPPREMAPDVPQGSA